MPTAETSVRKVQWEARIFLYTRELEMDLKAKIVKSLVEERNVSKLKFSTRRAAIRDNKINRSHWNKCRAGSRAHGTPLAWSLHTVLSEQ